MTETSVTVEVHTVLPDGRTVACTARAQRYECVVEKAFEIIPDLHGWKGQLELARFAERSCAPKVHTKVTVAASVAPEDADLVCFPIIVADRLARSGGAPINKLIVLGTSANWLLGQIVPGAEERYRRCLIELAKLPDVGAAEIWLPLVEDDATGLLREAVQAAHPAAILREIDALSEVAGLPSLGVKRRSATVWFPTVVGANAGELLPLELILRPVNPNARDSADSIRFVSTFAMTKRKEFVKLLTALRRHDNQRVGEWQTLIRVGDGSPTFNDNSWELALAIADRLARGREFRAEGRIIATGMLGRERDDDDAITPVVANVGGMEAKCQLILKELARSCGSEASMARILMPYAWRDSVSKDFIAALDNFGASYAFLTRVIA